MSTSRLHAIADKYLSRAVSAQVTFGKGPHDHGFTCEIVAYVPQGVVLKATDRGRWRPAAFEPPPRRSRSSCAATCAG